LRSYATVPYALIVPLKILHSWVVGEEQFAFLKITWTLGLKKGKHLSIEEQMLEAKS